MYKAVSKHFAVLDISFHTIIAVHLLNQIK
jgi:hypothetical protein